MREYVKHYINGDWVEPFGNEKCQVINPADASVSGEIVLANEKDVDRAVLAAKKAFVSYSNVSVSERVDILRSIVAVYAKYQPVH